MLRVWEDVCEQMAWKHFALLDCLVDELLILTLSTSFRCESLDVIRKK